MLLSLIGGLPVFRASPRTSAVDTFTLVPKLAVGHVLRYRQDLRLTHNGAIAHRSRSTVKVEVCERIAGGWVARWTSSESELLEADPRARPMLEALHALWDGVPIDLLLDDGGRVAGLADPDAMCALGAESLDRLAALLEADPASAPMAGALRFAMRPILAAGGMLAHSLLKEPAILLGAMGHDYRVGEPLEVRARIPSPMGTGEIPILGRYQVRAISSTEPRAEIGWLMVLDRASAARAVGTEILGVVRRTEAAKPVPAGEPPEQVAASTVAEATASLDFDDRCDFTIDTATAWPVSVRHVRSVSAGDNSRIDTVELMRLGG